MTAPAELLQAASAEEFAAARALFEDYAQQLGIDLCFQDIDYEFAHLSQIYAAPSGALLLARRDAAFVACGALRRRSATVCEMKRLYVRPEARGAHLGRRIAAALIDRARALHYSRMVLDTLASMSAAQSLYRSLGFREIPAYYANPLADALYMALDLPLSSGVPT